MSDRDEGSERKVRSGPNIPEAQRRTTRVVLRLPPDVADRLRELAAGETVSAYVSRLVRRQR